MQTFRIRTDQADTLQRYVDRLATRAKKLRLPPPTITTTPDGKIEVTHTITEQSETITRRYNVAASQVTVTGLAPIIEGHTIIGQIDRRLPTPLTYGDVTQPEATQTTCDHCGTARKRNWLIVVNHDTTGRKVLGSTCLADYVGHTDPTELAAYLQCIAAFQETVIRAERDPDDLGRGEQVFPPYRYVALALSFGAFISNSG